MEINNAPCGMDGPRTLLRNFRKHLGLTLIEMANLYQLDSRTLSGWVSKTKSGGPDIKNNMRLLVDLFSWYFSGTSSVKPIIVDRCQNSPGLLLWNFRNYLGLTKTQLACMYSIDRDTYRRWEESTQAGAPDLKNHVVLLRDFFKWYLGKVEM